MISQKDAEYIFENLAYNKKTYKDMASEFGICYSTLCAQMKKYKEFFGLKKNEHYGAKTWLRYKYANEIICKYSNGESTKKIAKDYGFTDDHMIATLLSSLGIQIRPVGYTSKTDQTLFSNIQTEAEAYAVGLITADGSVDSNYAISVTLHENDLYLLHSLNEVICNKTGVVRKNSNKATGYWKFCGKQICNNLKKFGIVPRKTYLLDNIYHFEDPILMQHYIRGLFDGDGVCSKQCNYLRLGYCAHNKSFTESFQVFMCSLLYLKRNKLFDTGGSWNCSWGAKSDIEKIYNYLYKDATLYLNRKKEKIEKYLYDNTEVTN